MTSPLVHLVGVPVLVCSPEGPELDEGEAMNLVAEAIQLDARAVSVPVQRCSGEFFTLATGVAGAVVQKFVNYRLPLAIVGDISDRVANSKALAAFVHETNRGNQVWFVADQEQLAERLDRHRRSGNQ